MVQGDVCTVNRGICGRAELSDVELKKLLSTIEKFRALTSSTLGRTNKIQHNIDTGDSQPIKQRHHVISPTS